MSHLRCWQRDVRARGAVSGRCASLPEFFPIGSRVHEFCEFHLPAEAFGAARDEAWLHREHGNGDVGTETGVGPSRRLRGIAAWHIDRYGEGGVLPAIAQGGAARPFARFSRAGAMGTASLSAGPFEPSQVGKGNPCCVWLAQAASRKAGPQNRVDDDLCLIERSRSIVGFRCNRDGQGKLAFERALQGRAGLGSRRLGC